MGKGCQGNREGIGGEETKMDVGGKGMCEEGIWREGGVGDREVEEECWEGHSGEQGGVYNCMDRCIRVGWWWFREGR